MKIVTTLVDAIYNGIIVSTIGIGLGCAFIYLFMYIWQAVDFWPLKVKKGRIDVR
jgi:hypothetical protein